MLVLEGRGVEHESDVPFGLVVDALDDHVATLAPQRLAALERDLAAVLPAMARAGRAAPTGAGAAERFHHHRALRELLALLGRERPPALLLDDLHWADAGSIEFVLHLVRRPPRAGAGGICVASRRSGAAVAGGRTRRAGLRAARARAAMTRSTPIPRPSSTSP